MRDAASLLPRFVRRAGLLLALCVTLPTQASQWQDIFGPPPEPYQTWPKHFRLGALVGFNFKGEFSVTGPISVSGNNPGVPGGLQNHSYDDGYVNIDATGNDSDLTWNWGYQNASQLLGETLSFHSVQSYEATSGGGTADGDPQVGFDMAYGGQIKKLWGGTLGWEFGFGLMPIEIKNNLSGSANVTRLIHSYQTGGIFLPQAPYQGSFEGPGAVISDEAVDGGTEVVGATVDGSQSLQVNLYNFRLGPTLQWEVHPRIALAVSVGAAFGIVGGDLEFNQTLTFAQGAPANVQGKSGNTEFVYGGYVSGTVLFHAVRNGDIYLGFQYMPMSNATFSGDGQEAKLDLTGGLYISAGFNWPF
jgi:hypothetical protein